MKTIAMVSGSMLALLASSAMAQSLDPVRIEMFRSILAGNDCVLTEAQAANILPRFDFQREETRAIVGALVAAGEVRLDGNTLNLIDGSCGSEDPVADLLGQRDVQQFIAVMAEHGCAMTEAEGEEIFTARGMGKDQVGAIIGPMIQNGMASFDPGQGVLNISRAYCSPAPVAVEVQPIEVAPTPNPTPTPAPMDATAQILAVFNAEGCSIPVANANAAFTEGGLTLQEALSGVGVFIASGQITVGAQGEFIADSSICGDPQTQIAVETPVETPVVTAVEPVPPVVENDGSPEGIFYSVMAQNGCVLAEETARELFPAAGLRMDQAYRITDALIESGEASLSNGGAELVVSSARCAQSDTPATPDAPVAVTEQQPVSPVSPEPTPVVVESTDPRAGLLAMLAANGCEVTQGNAAAMIGAAGLDYGPSMQMLSQMMADGSATTPDGGQTLQVGPPLCVAAMAEPQTPREVFINLIKQNNCSITAAEFNTLLPVDGLDASAAFAMISELEAEGVITLPATRDVVTLSAENCR